MHREEEAERVGGVQGKGFLSRGRLLLIALTLLSLLGGLALAETNTTTTTNTTATTTINVTIEIANVSLTQPPLINIEPRYMNESVLRGALQCVNPVSSACPLVDLVVGYNGAVFYNNTVNLTCSSPQCIKYIYIPVNTTRVWLYYSYSELSETYSQNITVTYFVSTYPQYVNYIISMLPFAIMAGLMVRSNPVAAGLGGIAAGVTIYLLGALGYTQYNITVVNIAILVGALLLYLSGR